MTVSPENEITALFHCTTCLPDKPESLTLEQWTSVEVGFTKIGVQIWCKRCNKEVAHLAFNKLPLALKEFSAAFARDIDLREAPTEKAWRELRQKVAVSAQDAHPPMKWDQLLTVIDHIGARHGASL